MTPGHTKDPQPTTAPAFPHPWAVLCLRVAQMCVETNLGAHTHRAEGQWCLHQQLPSSETVSHRPYSSLIWLQQLAHEAQGSSFLSAQHVLPRTALMCVETELRFSWMCSKDFPD